MGFKRIEERDEKGVLTVWGKEYPCGCKEYSTALTSGSFGGGQWKELCSECFFAKAETFGALRTALMTTESPVNIKVEVY